MKINRVLLPSTGLNRRRILSACATTPEEVQALLEWAANQMPNVGLDAILAEMETKAHAVLKRYKRNHLDQFTALEQDHIGSAGLEDFLRETIDQTRSEMSELNDRDPTRKTRERRRSYMAIERLSDAIEVLDRITRLRILLNTSNLQETTSDGIWLGRAFERMRLRAFEAHTWRGLNTTHQIRRAKRPCRNYSIYQTEFNECLREFPSTSTWQICKVLARKFRVSPRTIRRHIKDPRSPFDKPATLRGQDY